MTAFQGAVTFAPSGSLLENTISKQQAIVRFSPAGNLIGRTFFDPLFTDSSRIAFSNSFLTATAVATGLASTSARSNAFNSSSYPKLFCTATMNIVTGSVALGICNVNQANTTGLAASANAVGYFQDGAVKLNSVTLLTIQTFTTGDVVDMAVDFTNNRIWFRKNGGLWNNNAAGDPANNVAGIDISGLNPGPYYVAVEIDTIGDQVTMNFVDFVYTGPGDVVSGATAWWGLRAYSNATAGSNAIRLRASGDNAESDFKTLSNGNLDVVSIAAFQVTHGGSLFCTTLYDQTGNGNHMVQATAGTQPELQLSGLGPLPVLYFSGATTAKRLAVTSMTAVVQPLSAAFVSEQSSSTPLAPNYATILDRSDASAGFWWADNINFPPTHSGFDLNCGADAHWVDNAVPPPPSNSGTGPITSLWLAIQYIANNTSSFICANGITSPALSPSTGSPTGTSPSIGNDDFSDFLEGYVNEAGIWSGAWTVTQTNNMNANQRTYWGI